MPIKDVIEKNYSLVIYQTYEKKTSVQLALRKGGKVTEETKGYRIYGNPKKVGPTVLMIVNYAIAQEVDFKKAWDELEGLGLV